MAKILNDKEIDYICFAIENKCPLKLKWIFNMFSYVAEDTYEDDFIKIDSKKLYVNKNDEWVLLSDNYTEPVFNMLDVLTIDNSVLPTVKKETKTTLGRLIMNYIIGSFALKNKIPYINDMFTIGNIEKLYILPNLTDDVNDLTKIRVSDVRDFFNAVLYIDNFSKLLSVSATEKVILPPKGLDKYKKDLIAKYKKEYGEDALNDPNIMAKFEAELTNFDKEFYKDDPANNKLLDVGKVKTARKKMNVTYGRASTLDDSTQIVTKSLNEGWEKDPVELSKLYNDARSGSFSRGAETQKGGVVAKDTLRATSDIKIVKGDCKTDLYMLRDVTNSNKDSFIGRYIITNNNTLLLTNDNIKDYIGKSIKLRTPRFCRLEGNFCSTCTGEQLGDYENGISLLASGVGGDMLKDSLSAFHVVDLKISNISLDDIL